MQSLHTRALRRAAELVGGPDSLARHLHVPRDRLDHWLSGVLPVPAEVFLALVDVILAEGLTELKRSSKPAQDHAAPTGPKAPD